MRVLIGHMDRVFACAAVVRTDGRARLDRVRREPVVHQVKFGDMCGFRKSGIDAVFFAERPAKAIVVGRCFVQRRAFAAGRIGHVHHGRQHVVVDFDFLGRVLGLLHRIGHDHRDLIADVAGLADRQHRVRRLLHRLAVAAGDQPAAWEPGHLAVDVGAGEDAAHPGHGFGRGGVDALDAGVRVRRTQEHRVALRGQQHVVGVAAGAGQKPVVLAPQHGFADVRQVGKVGCAHDFCLLDFLGRAQAVASVGAAAPAMPAAPCLTALTMFW